MKIKQFLKPDWRKIVLTIVFILLSYFYVSGSIAETDSVSAWDFRGLPFIYLICELEYKVNTGYNLKTCQIKYLDLFINFLFWYFFSCLIIWIYDKLRKRK